MYELVFYGNVKYCRGDNTVDQEAHSKILDVEPRHNGIPDEVSQCQRGIEFRIGGGSVDMICTEMWILENRNAEDADNNSLDEGHNSDTQVYPGFRVFQRIVDAWEQQKQLRQLENNGVQNQTKHHRMQVIRDQLCLANFLWNELFNVFIHVWLYKCQRIIVFIALTESSELLHLSNMNCVWKRAKCFSS